MIKYMLEPVHFKQAKQWVNENHLLLSVSTFSLKIGKGFSSKQINFLLNRKSDVKISLLMNRLFHEKDFKEIELFFSSIDLSKIVYVFYTDLGLYQLAKQYAIQDKLVYDAYTYLTNSYDVNAYAKLNHAVVVSNQISLEELQFIVSNTQKKVMIHAFGKSIIFYSRRKLLTNYFQYRKIHKKANKRNFYLQEEFRSDKYHLYEDANGSYIYEKGFYYLMGELENLQDVSYAIIHSADLDAKTYDKVVQAYLERNEESLLKLPLLISKGIMEKPSVLLKERGDEHV